MYLGVELACRGGLERALSYFPTARLLKLLSQKRAKLRRQSTASSTAQFNFSLSQVSEVIAQSMEIVIFAKSAFPPPRNARLLHAHDFNPSKKIFNVYNVRDNRR